MFSRFRNVFLAIGGFLVVLLYIITDPDANIIQNLPFGANTVILLATLLKSIWYVGLLHLARRALFDYIDFSELIKKAEQTPQGAGYIAIAVGMAMIAIALVILAAVLSN